MLGPQFAPITSEMTPRRGNMFGSVGHRVEPIGVLSRDQSGVVLLSRVHEAETNRLVFSSTSYWSWYIRTRLRRDGVVESTERFEPTARETAQ